MPTQSSEKKPSIGCLGIPIFCLLGIGWAFIYTWPVTQRYRVTVSVQTPAGIRNGSTVLEATSRNEINILPDQHSTSTTFRGEAAVVELPNGQTIFALLRQDAIKRDDGSRSIWDLIERTSAARTPQHQIGIAKPILLPRYLAAGRTTRPNEAGIPMLVRFHDLSKPKSFERVDPDNLEATFGEGYSLRGISFQATDEAPAFTLSSKLKWLSPYPEPLINPARDAYDYAPVVRLTMGDFSLR